MTSIDLPSQAIHPDLTEDRLRAVAKTIVDYRAAKVRRRMPPDGSWNVGCDCYAWQCYGIRERAKGEFRDWLFVPPNEGVEFLFLIGGPSGVPAKFYRSDAQGQPARTLNISFPELTAIQGCLWPNDQPKDAVIRFAVELADDGFVKAVTLVQLDQSGDVSYAWPIPLDRPGIVSFDFAPRADAVELAPPPVILPEDEEDRRRGKGETDQKGA